MPEVLVCAKLAVKLPCPLPDVLGYPENGCCVTFNSFPSGIPVNELPDTSVQNQTLPANGKFEDVKNAFSLNVSAVKNCTKKK